MDMLGPGDTRAVGRRCGARIARLVVLALLLSLPAQRLHAEELVTKVYVAGPAELDCMRTRDRASGEDPPGDDDDDDDDDEGPPRFSLQEFFERFGVASRPGVAWPTTPAGGR